MFGSWAILRKYKLRSLTACAVLILAVMTAGWWSRNPLDEFVDRDLGKLDDHSNATWRKLLGRYVPEELLNAKLRLQKIIDSTLPEKYASKGIGYQPLYLWRYQDSGDPRFLLSLVKHDVSPRFAWSALHFLDSTGKPISCSEFSTTLSVEDATLRWEPIVNERVLEIRLSGFGPEESPRLVFSFFPNRVAFIHAEGGALSYLQDALPPSRTAEECVAQLNSDRPSIVLEALSAMCRFDRGLVLVEDLRYDPSLKEKVTKLSRSPNPWISRSAANALFVINH